VIILFICLVCCELCSSDIYCEALHYSKVFQENVFMSSDDISASSWGFCFRKQCLWVAFIKKSHNCTISHNTAVCPKVGEREQLQSHFREQENPAPPLFKAVLSCSLQPIPHSYLTVLKIIHPPPLLPWQLEGKSILSASSSHYILPPPAPLSRSFPTNHSFLYLSMLSRVILLSSCLSQRIDRQQRM